MVTRRIALIGAGNISHAHAEALRSIAGVRVTTVVDPNRALAESLAWVVEACSGRDWREIMPQLAGYPGELFDYGAEDAYLAGSRS